jgi:hypothetical protein
VAANVALRGYDPGATAGVTEHDAGTGAIRRRHAGLTREHASVSDGAANRDRRQNLKLSTRFAVSVNG